MDNPLTIKESAVAIHEMYVSLMEAGFTKEQALYLVGQLMAGTQGNPS